MYHTRLSFFVLYLFFYSALLAGNAEAAKICGDGSVHPSEDCDDGNLQNGDGCSSTCSVEQGWTCSGSPSICKRCGDGILQTGEQCDDGNVQQADGCNSNCAIESGWTCTGQPSVCKRCGDGVVQPGEECDDGNNVNNDGCNTTCKVVSGWSCTGSPSQCVNLVCTANLSMSGQACNDGNAQQGDGCSNSIVEPGWVCTYSPSVCRKCGDGILHFCEVCDDANTASYDGCSSSCTLESGWTCTGSPSACRRCGDGVVQPGEQCDDNNVATGDGCDSTCMIEASWTCLNSSPSVCKKCGDGIWQSGALEGCDDFNIVSGDGCSSSCVIEIGWNCSGNPSVCTAICGDGIQVGRETCDDGNIIPGDGCGSTCDTEIGWSCTGQPSSCLTVCGDGKITSSERCDDGNTKSSDGCSSSCEVEEGWNCTGVTRSICSESCGNGVRTFSEECDDGNTIDGDGCSGCKVDHEFTCIGYKPSACSLNGIKDPVVVSSSSHKQTSDTAMIVAAVLIPVTCLALIGVVAVVVWKRRRLGIDLPNISVEIGHRPDSLSDPRDSIEIIDHTHPTTYSSINAASARGSTRGYVDMFSPKQWQIDYQEITIEKELGRGAYGIVYSGKWRNQTVAVKKLIGQLNEQQLLDFLGEAEIMSSILPHENVVQLYGVCCNPPCIILKYYPNGSLLEYIKSDNKLTMQVTVGILKGIASGCAHLHREKIVHRDLAARNVLLNQNMSPVVSDFGFARAIDNDSGQTQSIIGPIKWMSPEALQSGTYSYKSDVWSWGVTAWEVITRSIPFGTLEPVNAALEVVGGRTADCLVIPSHVPQDLTNLIRQCWSMDPDKRPTIQEVYDRLYTIESQFKPK